MQQDHVTLRPAGPSDALALERLSQLEGRRLPPGPHLIALRGGEAQALICLRTHEVLADPFQPTADLRPLLALQAMQMRAQSPRQPSRPIHARELARA